MKLRIDGEEKAYMDFIKANQSAEYVFVGSAQIFLDKILWMDEHFRKLPDGYDSILEIESFVDVNQIINIWKKNPSFSILNEAQNNLYEKALDYLYKYRTIRTSEIEPKNKDARSNGRRKPSLKGAEKNKRNSYTGRKKGDFHQEYQRLLKTEPGEELDVSRNVRNKKLENKSENVEIDKDETIDGSGAFDKRPLEHETSVLSKKRILRAQKGWEQRKIVLYSGQFRKSANQVDAVRRWRKKEKVYEPAVLPNGKRWNDVIAVFKREAKDSGSKEEKPRFTDVKKEYKPLTVLTVRAKEAKTNIELLKVQACIQTELKAKVRKADFYVWLLLSKNLSESRAEDMVHLMDICDEISAELGISDIKLREIEDTEELSNYAERLEADHRFRKIDRKFFCKITQSLEWYCEFAVEYAQDWKQ